MTNNPDTFIGEFEVMDLSELQGKIFAVAVATGNPE